MSQPNKSSGSRAIACIPNTGFLSETSRQLAIGRALASRGHRVVFGSHGGPFESYLEQAGFQVTRLEPRMDAGLQSRFLDAILTLGTKNVRFYDDDFFDRAVRAEVDFLRATGAEAVSVGFNLTTYVSSRAAGVPLVASHGGSFLPPVLERGLCPAPVNSPLPFMRLLPARAQRFLSNRVPFWLRAPVRDFNRAADRFGTERLPGMMQLMCGDLTLVTDAPEVLGIPQVELDRWRPDPGVAFASTTMRYSGPLFARLDLPVPARVSAFIDGADGPVVYVSLSSVREPFLREVVGAVKQLGVRTLVGATIHSVADLEDERTMVAGVLPNHLVMPKVSAAVIMGGQGTTQTAMTAGVPFVGLPYHAEQELNVALAERQGMAVRLSPRDARGVALTRAVRRLLDDPEVSARARAVAEVYARYDGPSLAAEAIEQWLGRVSVAGPSRLAS
ncbi:MAG: glycosyltransferase [Myxococcaceae bacterium]